MSSDPSKLSYEDAAARLGITVDELKELRTDGRIRDYPDYGNWTFKADEVDALAEELDVPLLGQIPLLQALREGGDVGRPIIVADPDGEAATVFTEMARLLAEEYLPTRRYNEGLKLV